MKRGIIALACALALSACNQPPAAEEEVYDGGNLTAPAETQDPTPAPVDITGAVTPEIESEEPVEAPAPPEFKAEAGGLLESRFLATVGQCSFYQVKITGRQYTLVQNERDPYNGEHEPRCILLRE